MTRPEAAFQTYALDRVGVEHDFHLRFRKPIYIARHHPYMLARAIMDAGRQVLLKHGKQPTSVIVDLPCSLFMIDNRNLTVVEDIARLLEFSPHITVRPSPLHCGAREWCPVLLERRDPNVP